MGVNNMLAPCITTVPVRVKVLEPTRVIDIVQQAQSESSQIMEYQFTPLRLIQQWIGGSGALFNSLFSFNIHTDGGEDQQSFWKLLNESSRIDVSFILFNVNKRNLTYKCSIQWHLRQHLIYHQTN